MKKQGYFSHDSNARSDEKILNLRMALGAEGYGIYFMLLERMREDPDYMSIKDYNMLAFDFRVDAAKVKRVVEEFGLFTFTDDGKRFYSKSFNQRMNAKDVQKNSISEARRKAAQARWAKAKTSTESDDECICIANAQKNDANSCQVKESKVKEREVKGSKGEQRQFAFKLSNELSAAFTHLTGVSNLSQGHKQRLTELASKYTEDWIIDAFGIAEKRGIRRLAYAEGILKDWAVNGKEPNVNPAQASHKKDWSKVTGW